MDYPESTLPYVALVARLEILAESLATEPAIRASVPQVQDREDVVEDPAETSQQGAADSSTDVAGKTWEEVASLLNSIADGLRTKENRRPLASTSLPSLLTTFIRLILLLSPLASSSTAAAVIVNHSQLTDFDLPSVEKLALAESAVTESDVGETRPRWLTELETVDAETLYQHVAENEEVVKQIGRVAANLSIDEDPNREILNLYQYPTSATQLLHIYGIGLGRSTSLPESRVGALRALIGSTLNLAVGDVAAIKSHFLHQPVMDALLRLNVALTEAATAAGNPDLTEDVEKLCGWLWKMVESASMDDKTAMSPSSLLLKSLEHAISPFFEGSKATATCSPSTALATLIIASSVTERAFSDSPAALSLLLQSDARTLRRLLGFIEKGSPPYEWSALSEDGDSEEEEDGGTAPTGNAGVKLTSFQKWHRQVGLAKAAILRVIIEMCHELEMSNESKAWFWNEMDRWLETYSRKKTSDGEVDEGREDLVSCALLCLGNFARTEQTALSLLSPARSKPLLPLLRPLLRGSTPPQTQHALIGLLKNLAIPAVNKSILGSAGIIEGICDMGVWLKKKDMLGSIQGGGVSVVKHLCYGNVSNSLKIANNLSANTQDGPLHQLLALHARTDDVAVKCETARVLVNVIRSLWIVAGKSTDSTATMESAVEEGKKTMLQPEVVKALEDLLKAGKEAGHGLLVNEAVVAMASMCRDAAGLGLVAQSFPTSSIPEKGVASISTLTSLLGPQPSIAQPSNPMAAPRQLVVSSETKSNILVLIRLLLLGPLRGQSVRKDVRDDLETLKTVEGEDPKIRAAVEEVLDVLPPTS